MRLLFKKLILFLGYVFHYNHKSKILFYHDIYCSVNYKALDVDVCMGTHIDMFKKHVDVIRNEGFEIVRQITKPEGQVAIMLDDGFRGIYEVRNYFYENNIFPTIFLPAGHLGKDCLLSNKEILDLQEHGFKFECHSWSHVDLTKLNDNELVRELKESKEMLSKILGKDVTEICLPIGYFTEHLLCKLREFEYKEVYSSIPGNYAEPVHGWMRCRHLCQFATPTDVKFILHGGNDMISSHYEKMHNKS